MLIAPDHAAIGPPNGSATAPAAMVNVTRPSAVSPLRTATFPFHAASLGVIRRLGMTKVGTRDHEVLGELLVFERRRG